MKTRYHRALTSFKPAKLLLLLLLVTLLFPLSYSRSGTPTVEKIAPVRQFFVSPSGSGTGVDRSQAMSVSKAIQGAQPGDWFWFVGGTYRGPYDLARSGTAAKPIVFRALAGEHVTINGGFQISGAYTWVWGFEVTDPNDISEFDSGIRIANRGVRVINNIIHDVTIKNGMGAWNTGRGQIIYGNIFYRNDGHSIYMQNNFFQNGLKVLSDNMLLDPGYPGCPHKCFNIHGYTLNGYVSGFNFRRNIVKDGRFLIGGFNAPAEHEIVTDNFFYKSPVQFGYRRPTQVRFTGNYLGRSTLDTRWFWGSGEVQYRQSAPNIFTGNQIHRPPGTHIRFTTSAYLPSGRCEGCPGIRPVDVWDQNTYSNPFKAFFFANNVRRSQINLAEWRNATGNAGKRFDSRSKTVPPPTVPKIAILRNQYEPARANLVIFNWGKRPTITVNLAPFIPLGVGYEIRQPKDFFGAPVQSGINTGSITINTGRQEFLAFVLFRR